MQTQVSSIENKYKTEIQYWVQKNNDLQEQIQKTDSALGKSKQEGNSLKGKIQKMISSPKTPSDSPKGEKLRVQPSPLWGEMERGLRI